MNRIFGGLTVAVLMGFFGWGVANAGPGDILSVSKISNLYGGFSETLVAGDQFGHAIANIGDLDGDGVTDYAVGARGLDDGGENRGGLFILFMNAGGTVRDTVRVSDTNNTPASFVLDDKDQWTSMSVRPIGDFNGDGVTDLAVGTTSDDDGGENRGALYLLYMNTDGSVADFDKISSTQGGFTGPLQNWDYFGNSVVSLGDLDDDGIVDLAVGASHSNSASTGFSEGAVYILFMNADGTVKNDVVINNDTVGFAGALTPSYDPSSSDIFGIAVENLGDLNGDGNDELMVGAYLADQGGPNSGTLFTFFLNDDGSIQSYNEIDSVNGVFGGVLQSGDFLGTTIATLGDISGDGLPEVAVQAYARDDSNGLNEGSVFVLSLDANADIIGYTEWSYEHPAFTGYVDLKDFVGSSLHSAGDVDGDGCTDLIAGAYADDDGGDNAGAAYIVYLDCSVGGGGPLSAPVVPIGAESLKFMDVGTTSAVIEWEEAEDNATPKEELVYEVFVAREGVAFGTLVETREHGEKKVEVVGGTSARIEGLIPGRRYQANVIVTDEDANEALYGGIVLETVDDGFPRGQLVRLGTTQRYYFINEEGTVSYQVKSRLMTATWLSVIANVPTIKIKDLRVAPTAERVALARPGTVVVQVGERYYWIEGGVDPMDSVLRPFESREQVESILGRTWRRFVVQATEFDIEGAQMEEVIISGESLPLEELMDRATLREYLR